MIKDLYFYATSLGWNGWSIITATLIPPFANEWLRSKFWFTRLANKVSGPETRRLFLFALSIITMFAAGFMTWREEHIARKELTNKQSDIFKQLETDFPRLPDSPDNLKKGQICNNGGTLGVVQ